MEELDIAELEKNGYSYDTANGFIVDRSGAYVESVNINIDGTPRTYASEMTRPNYEAYQARQEKLKNSGYEPQGTPVSQMQKLAEEDIHLGVTAMEKWTGLPQSDEVVAAYNKKHGTDYNGVADFKERGLANSGLNSFEEAFVRNSVENGQEDLANQYLENKALLKETKEKVAKDRIKGVGEGMKAASPDSMIAGAAKWFSNLFNDAVEDVSTVETPEGEKSVKAIKDAAEAKIKEAIKPFTKMEAEKAKAEAEKWEAEVDRINKEAFETGKTMTKELWYARTARDKYKKTANDYNDFADGAMFDSNIATADTALDVTTLGVYDLLKAGANFAAMRDIQKIQEEGGDVREHPELWGLVQSTLKEQQSGEAGLKYSTLRDISGGVVESSKFMAEMYLSGGISKGIGTGLKKVGADTATKKVVDATLQGAKTVLKGNSKILNRAKTAANKAGAQSLDDLSILTQKGLADGLELTAGTMFMPSTYGGALADYDGAITMVETADGLPKILTTPENYKYTMERFERAETAYKEMISAEEDPTRKAALESELSQITQQKAKVVAPRTLGQSFIKQIGANFTERLSESVVGPLLGKVGGSINKRVAKGLEGSKMFNYDKVQDFYGRFLTKKNKYADSNSVTRFIDKQVQNPIPEALEEVFVQAMPQAFETKSEREQRLKELTSLDFYTNVIGITQGQQLLFGSVGALSGAANRMAQPAEYKAQRDELSKIYDDLNKKAVTDPQVREQLLSMKMGVDTPAAEYDSMIDMYKSMGDDVSADRIEDMKFNHQAMEAQRYGMLPKHIDALTNILKSPGIPEGTKTNVAKSLVYAKELSALNGKYKNGPEIALVRARKKANLDKVAEIREDAITGNTNAQEQWNNYRTKNGIDEISLDTFIDNARKDGTLADVMKSIKSEDLGRYVDGMNKIRAFEEASNAFATHEKKITSPLYQTQLTEMQTATKRGIKIIDQMGVKAENLDDVMKGIEEAGGAMYMTPDNKAEVRTALAQYIEDKREQKRAKVSSEAAELAKAETDKEGVPVDAEENKDPRPELTNEEEALFEYAMHHAQEKEMEIDDLPAGQGKKAVEKMKGVLQMLPDASFGDLMDSLVNIAIDPPNKTDLALMYMEYLEAGGKTFDPVQGAKEIDQVFNALKDEDQTYIDPVVPSKRVEDTPTVLETEPEATPVDGPVEAEPEVELTEEEILKQALAEATSDSTLAAESLEYPTTVGFSNLEVAFDENNNLVDIGERDFDTVDSRLFSDPEAIQIGSSLDIELIDQSEWGNVLVSRGDSNDAIPFSQWVAEKLTEKNMDVGTFMQTDEFRQKVPMFYKSGDSRVGFVHDADWYDKGIRNPDNSKYKEEILAGAKQSALALRENFLNGHVSKVEVTTKDGNILFHPDGQINSIASNTDEKTIMAVAMTGDTGGLTDPATGKKIPSNRIINYEKLQEMIRKNNNRSFALYPHYKDVNGQMMYKFALVMTINENGEAGAGKFHSRDLAAVRELFTAYYKVTGKRAPETPEYRAHADNMTVERAEEILKTLGKSHGLFDGRNFDHISRVANSMLVFRSQNGGLITAMDRQKKNGYYVDALFDGKATPQTNMGKDAMALKLEGGRLVGITSRAEYQDHLKERYGNSVRTIEAGGTMTTNVQPLVRVREDRTNIPVAPKPIEFSTPVAPTAAEISPSSLLEEAEALEPTPSAPTASAVTEVNIPVDQAPEVTIEQVNEALKALGIEDPRQVLMNHTIIDDVPLSALKLSEKEFVKGELLSRLSFAIEQAEEGVTPEMVVEEFRDSMVQTKKNIESTLASVKALRESDPELSNLEVSEQALESLALKVDALASKEGMDQLYSEVKDFAKAEGLFEESTDEFGIVRDFNSSSAEDNHGKKLMPQVKRVFASVHTNKKGFLGLPARPSYNDIHKVLQTIMSAEPHIDNSFPQMIERIREVYNTSPIELDWLGDIADAMESTSSEVQKAFAVNMYKFPMNGKTVMYQLDDNGTSKVQVFDITAGSGKNKIKGSWVNGFSAKLEDGNLTQEKAAKLIQEYKDLEKTRANAPAIRTWLSKLGITVSDVTWKELVDKGLKRKDGEREPFENLFNVQGRQLFANLNIFLNNRMKELKPGEQVSVDSDSKLVPHTSSEARSSLNRLIDMEAANDPTISTTMTRDGGKSVSNVQYSSLFYDTFKDLANGKIDRDSFTENSFLMDILDQHPEIRKELAYGQIGLQSMKNTGTNRAGESADQLSDSDRIRLHKYLFQNVAGLRPISDEVKLAYGGVQLRYAQMPTPTLSDKGRLMTVTVPVLNLFADQKNAYFEGSQLVLSDNIKEIIYNRLVLPELTRAIKTRGKKHNIDVFDRAKARFNFISELNHLETPFAEFLEETAQLTPEAALALFKERHFEQAVDVAYQASIDLDAGPKIEHNKEYIGQANKSTRSEGLTQQQTEILADVDHKLNYSMHMMDMMQIFAGDPAMYAKRIDDSTPATSKKSSDTLGTNLSKRLAALIAPGNVLANAQNESYFQIHMKDSVRTSKVFEKIIDQIYPDKPLTDADKAVIQGVRAGSMDRKSAEYKQFEEKYEDALDYLDIETTDAQEYTTLAEHLKVMLGMGVITQAKYDDIIDRVYYKGEQLDPSDTSIILQPVKPVYTGFTMRDGVRTLNYVKSSSVPLLPGVHENTELGPLMQKMMDMERSTDMVTTVRASYHTANKVGHVAAENAIDPFNEADLDKLSGNAMWKNSVELMPRRNFRIQQENPYKGGKPKLATVSMGTQITKILFGNGFADTDFDGTPGRELMERFTENYRKLTALNESELNETLGDGEGNPSMEKLAAKIRSTMEASGDLSPDIEQILSPANFVDGDFMVPLWATASGEKIEAVMNSIINSSLLRIKVPGSSFIVSSSQGLAEKEKLGASQIISVDPDYKGGDLKDGEMLIPSRIQLGSTLVDLYKKKGNSYVYLTETEDGLRINPEMVDLEIFRQFGYRTPTSSHTTGSGIKIVGILPAYVGDQGVASRDLIPQMGQDHDNDKLSLYNNLVVQGENGKLEVLSEKNKDKWDEKGSQMSVEKALIFQDMLNVYKQVYFTSNKAVQAKIRTPLSTSTAERQVSDILKIRNAAEGTDLNVLSFNYQNNKMRQGSSGAAAIGVYAKALTMLSRIQQIPKEFRPAAMGKEIMIEGTTIASDFSNTMNSTGTRSVAKVIDERTNLATDNAKLGVLGVAGLDNLKAVAVDSYLAIIGADEYHDPKEGKNLSFSFMLHTHPIIKELHNRFQEAQKIDGKSNVSIRSVVNEMMIEHLGGFKEFLNFQKAQSTEPITFTADELRGETDNHAEIIWNYYQLHKKASEFGKLTTKADFDNLGLNLFKTMETVQGVNEIQDGEVDIQNADQVLGNSIMGTMINAAVEASDRYLFNHHPYNEVPMRNMMANLGAEMSDDKNFVKRELVKFLHASTAGLSDMDNVAKAKELFYKGDTLAKYIARVKSLDGHNELKDNLFIKNLTRKAKKNTKHAADLLELQDSMNADATTDMLMRESIQELYTRDIALPDRNGKPYSTQMLIKDLFMHNTLGGMTSRSPGTFHHLLPVELYSLGVADNIRNGVNLETLREFQDDFIRHNPEWKSIKDVHAMKKTTFDGTHLTIESDQPYPNHIRTVDAVGNSILYSLVDPNTGEYKKLVKKIDDGRTHYRSNVYTPVGTVEKKEMKTKVAEQLQSISNNPLVDEKTKELATTIARLIPGELDMTISSEPSNKLGQYDPNEDRVTIYPANIEKLQNGKSFDQNSAEVMLHEMIHSLTSIMINQYEKGLDAPAEYTKLVQAKNAYKSLVSQDPAFAKFMEKYKKYQESKKSDIPFNDKFTPEEIGKFYPAVSTKEFVAGMANSNEMMAAIMDNNEYKKTGKTFSEFVKEILPALIKKIFAAYNGGTPMSNENAIIEMFNVSMDAIQSISAHKTRYMKAKKEFDSEAERLLKAQQEIEDYYANRPPDDYSEYDDIPLSSARAQQLKDILNIVEKVLPFRGEKMSREAAVAKAIAINTKAKARISSIASNGDGSFSLRVADLEGMAEYAEALDNKVGMTRAEWMGLTEREKEIAIQQAKEC